ncbi:1-phosphatidylinositol 3-phosphate 5-kinase, partial [Armadillidium nasatum]
MIKSIAIQGYGVFSSIVDRLSTISEEIGQRWDPLLESVATHHQKQKQIFRESIEKIQLQLTSPTLEKRRCNQEALKFDKDLANILNEISDQIVLLKGQIVQVVQDWNSKVQDLLNLRKKDDKDKQRTNSGNISRPSGSLLSSTSSTLTGSVEQLQLSSKDEIFNHQEISDSSDHTIEEEKGDVFHEEQRNECSTTEENKTSGIENKKVVGTQREEKITAGVSSPTSARSVSSFLNDSTEKDVSGGIRAVLGSKEVSQGSELISRHRQISSTSGNVRSGLEQFIPSPSRVGHHERSFSDESEAVIAKDILERIPEKRYSSSVKNIISTLWSSSADLMIKSPFDPMEHYNILPEVKIPVVINDDEPSSIIAKALASQEYETKLQILQVKLNELQQGLENSHKTTESSNSSPTTVSNTSQEGVATKGSDSDKQSSQKDMHIDLQWNDSHANYYCKILFVDQFRELRQLIFPSGEELFIRSLSRCVSWDARGGKSGSAFCKTVDDRFVLKEMSRFEINSFLEFAPAYIQYITNCNKKNIPTALTRIVGVYRIGYKNTLTNRAEKFDFLVMENLFYQRSISTKFDLKGSERNRKVKLTGKEESEVVLLDENLLQMACSSPFYLRPHGKDVLTRAIVEDSNFLSQQFIMDYSLLVGVDEENNQLVVGIIDYIRTFTWDKKLETIIKGSRLAGGAGKSPTILSPDSYRNRFCLAMESYFVLAPDRWTSLEEGNEL